MTSTVSTYDELGQHLHLLACLLTHDADLAGELVVQTIRAHEDEPRTLRDLSAGVYDAWVAWGRPAPSARTLPTGAAEETDLLVREIHRLPAGQRAALGLCAYGGHDYRQAADVLATTPAVLARLLRDALRAIATPRARPASAA